MGQLYNPPALPLAANGLLWSLIGANMNSTADQAFTKAFSFTNYIIDRIIATNASTSPTLAAGGIYTAASKGGTAVVAAAQVFSGLTASGLVLPLTIANTDLRTGANLFLALTTGQGGAATLDLRIFGYAIT